MCNVLNVMAPAAPCTALHCTALHSTSSSLFIEIFSLYNHIFPPQLLEKEVPGRNSSSHQHGHTRLLWHVTVFNPPDTAHVAGDTRHAAYKLRSFQQWQWEVSRKQSQHVI